MDTTGPHIDPHDVLGIPTDADEEEVRRAYRRKAAQYHPDKVSHLGPEFRDLAEARMREINAAYRTLTGADPRHVDTNPPESAAEPDASADEPAETLRNDTSKTDAEPRSRAPRLLLMVIAAVAAVLAISLTAARWVRTTKPTGNELARAQEYAANGVGEEALVLLHRVTRRDADNLDAWNLRWRSELALGVLEDAEKSLDRAIVLDASDVELRRERARLLYRAGKLDGVASELLWMRRNSLRHEAMALLEEFARGDPQTASHLRRQMEAGAP